MPEEDRGEVHKMGCSVAPLRWGKDSGLRASEAGDMQHQMGEVLTEGCARENVRKTQDTPLSPADQDRNGGSWEASFKMALVDHEQGFSPQWAHH